MRRRLAKGKTRPGRRPRRGKLRRFRFASWTARNRTTLGHDLAGRLAKWARGGQFGFLFDNAEDTISFSRFQCFDFQRMSQYSELLEQLLFYILHRANTVIAAISRCWR